MLWMNLTCAILACIALLYVPGMLLLKAARFDWAYSISFAPAVSSCIMAVSCVALPLAGVSCTWVTILAAYAVLVALGCLCAYVFCRRKGVSVSTCLDGFSVFGLSKSLSFALTWVVALVVGVCAGTLFFLMSIESPESFFQAFDNAHHINGIALFVETGNWSSLDGGFYPSCWQDFAAFVVSCLGISEPIAVNAVNFTFSFVVFPLSMLLLLCELFPEEPLAVFVGGALSSAFAAFPWELLVFGPIYPNLSALAVVPAVMALFIALVRSIERGVRGQRLVAKAVFFVIGCVSLFFLQPNTIFFAVVFLALFCAVFVGRMVASTAAFERKQGLGRCIGFALCLVLIAVIWCLLYKTSFIQGILGEPGYKLFGMKEAAMHALSLSFTTYSPQPVLAALCLVGAVYSLVNRKYLWMSGSAALCLALFVISVTDCNALIRNVATGCWYHDAFRLAANAVIACIPLAALGFVAALKLLHKVCLSKAPAAVSGGVAVVALALLAGAAFVPVTHEDGSASAFEAIRSEIAMKYSTNPYECILTADEMEFAKQVKDIVGDDVVINVPDDGSVFLYGTQNINVMYTRTRIWDPTTEDWKSREIRTSLIDLASDSDVARAVEEVHAQYVLLLDKGATADDTSQAWFFTWRWNADWWDGIMNIDEDTQGFELLLSEGDMRLYRIAA